MEEDGGVKAPVTRLRRRLSVEQPDEAKSPATPSTPSKKRGGRLAAKPQLDLIEENVPASSPRRATRKSIAPEITEPIEEKATTPARRSTRIKSNTSIVSETALATVDSPRARRAARRNSQIDDTETPVTPARKTRRTRKDSTSSIDNQADIASNKQPEISKEVITEETEVTGNTKSDNVSPSATRKSPRLANRNSRSSSSKPDDLVINADKNEKVISPPSNKHEKIEEDNKSTISSTNDEVDNSQEHKEKDSLSNSAYDLLSNVSSKSKTFTSLNKSTSAINTIKSQESRSRTRSWCNVAEVESKENPFYSDNESLKKKIGKNKSLTPSKVSDDVHNTVEDDNIVSNKSSSKKKRKSQHSIADVDKSISELNNSTIVPAKTDKSIIESNKENIAETGALLNRSAIADLFEKAPSGEKVTVLIEDSDSNRDCSLSPGNTKLDDGEDQCVPVVDHALEQDMSTKQSDISINKSAKEDKSESISSGYNSINKASNNDSCEPMDIDETIPENVSFTDLSKGHNLQQSLIENTTSKDLEANDKANKSKRKSSFADSSKIESVSNNVSLTASVNLDKSGIENTNNKSKRKSSVSIIQDLETSASNNSKRKSSLSHIQDLEKSGNENKSTLILSQIKDVSTELNVLPKIQNEILSKSINVPDVGENNEIKVKSKKNKSLNMADTPLQQKNIQRLGMQTSTPVLNSKIEKEEVNKDISKKDVSRISKHAKSDSESEEVSESEASQEHNSLVDDEAEEASDDYESGDSQDEEEKLYAEENEIVEKGETLTSEEEMSDDSDYEKDSFIVSSDEEDEELLSGSGDDLDMSDNELKMNKKSKKKFDERKLKEQKRASREMFQARHALDESTNSTSSEKIKPKKNNRQRIDSSMLGSEDDDIIPKRKNRLRLDSTQEKSVGKSEDEDSIRITKKKTKRLSVSADESICDKGEVNISKVNESQSSSKKKNKRVSGTNFEEPVNELEITCDNIAVPKEQDPLIAAVKREPKTPQNSFNISSVNFTVREEVENVEVNEDVSMSKPNDSVDPLQATMAKDEEDEESLSENEEIMQNYDSILNDLNKSQKSKIIKSQDISVNLDKKSKKKQKDPIVDQLNLTQTKPSKKVKKVLGHDAEEKAPKTDNNTSNKFPNVEDENSSDSINLKLLFSDESNDSNKETNENKLEESHEHIPQKKSDTISIPDEVDGATDVLFFVDTTGALEHGTDMDTSINTSKKKNKNKDKSISVVYDAYAASTEQSAMNTSLNTSTSKKKKNEGSTLIHTQELEPADTSVAKTPKSEKKKKRLSESQEINNINEQENNEAPMEMPIESAKKKKDRKSIADIVNVEETESNNPEISLHTSMSQKKKKQKNKNNDTIDEGLITHVATPVSEKKNILSESLNSKLVPSSDHKKKQNSISESSSGVPQTQIENEDDAPVELSAKKESYLESSESLNVQKSKKRKRKSSGQYEEHPTKDKLPILNESLAAASQNKKLKISNEEIVASHINEDLPKGEAKKSKKKNKQEVDAEENHSSNNKKRKEREDDEGNKIKSKIHKGNTFEKVSVPRLPSSIINQLDDKPKHENLPKQKKLVSTTEFAVEQIKNRKNKPSNYLEESIYLNDDDLADAKNGKKILKKPKVLPFIPTASTSGQGFTTNFKVKIIPNEVKFVAQSNNVSNFKDNYFNSKKIKRLGTYDLYKKHRNIKLSKF